MTCSTESGREGTETVDRDQPTFGAYSNLASLYSAEHRFHESVAASLAALQLNDQNYDVWGNLVIAYEWLKDDEHRESRGQGRWRWWKEKWN